MPDDQKRRDQKFDAACAHVDLAVKNLTASIRQKMCPDDGNLATTFRRTGNA